MATFAMASQTHGSKVLDLGVLEDNLSVNRKCSLQDVTQILFTYTEIQTSSFDL